MIRVPGFGCVLMDVQMPEMDGFECTALIREQRTDDRLHLPIIAMTAHAMKGDEARCLAAGMDAYLSKPIQPDELFDVVERTSAPSPSSTPVRNTWPRLRSPPQTRGRAMTFWIVAACPGVAAAAAF